MQLYNKGNHCLSNLVALLTSCNVSHVMWIIAHCNQTTSGAIQLHHLEHNWYLEVQVSLRKTVDKNRARHREAGNGRRKLHTAASHRVGQDPSRKHPGDAPLPPCLALHCLAHRCHPTFLTPNAKACLFYPCPLQAFYIHTPDNDSGVGYRNRRVLDVNFVLAPCLGSQIAK
jgi:hypothetical protein